MLEPAQLINILMSEQVAALESIKDTIPRQARFPDVPNKIQVAIGMRRVGKTTFLLQHIRQLLTKENIPYQRILYINFEDDRLLPCDQAQFGALLDAFYTVHPSNHEHECYFFLDEIQNVTGWDLVIRRFFDKRKVRIYLSGSSAKMLSKEISTSLRGRAMPTEIWPYSFHEFLVANKVPLAGDYLSTQNQDILIDQLKQFLKQGGFPEIVHQPWIHARAILQNYTELVIMKDIVDRYHIKNISLIKYMVKTLLKNTGTGFSVNKFHKDVKSQKIDGSAHVIHDYLSYLEDAYFSFLVPIYDESLRKIQSNPRKIYTIDSGVFQAFTFDPWIAQALSFENTNFDLLGLKSTDKPLEIFTCKIPTFEEICKSLLPSGDEKYKSYAVDSGLSKTFLGLSDNYGHLFENLIYLDLRRQGHTIHYALTEARHEIDFFTENAHGEHRAYQVVWDIHNPETVLREQRALDEFYAEKGIRGELITPQIYIEKIWNSMKSGERYYL